METLKQYLDENLDNRGLASVLLSLAKGVKNISAVFAVAGSEQMGKAGTQNVSGEDQLALDVQADIIMQEEMVKNPNVGLVASEEQADVVDVGDGEYAACYDPLDGSSLIDSNLSVGSIIGVYKTGDIIGMKGDDQVASMIAVYGPRTIVVLTFMKGVVAFMLNKEGEFVLDVDGFSVGEGKMFAPGNLRACASRDDYVELMNYWCKNKYKLRYSGGMVPDIYQIFVKGMGIFLYPGFDESPDGKLRLLVECAPMALLMEQAGGAASDGGMRILEKKIESIHQRTPIFIGSKIEVERCKKFLK